MSKADTIHKKFYRHDLPRPVAHTVAQLKAILAELPDDLRVEAGFGDAVKLVVYNHGQVDMHLEFEEHETDPDED